MILCYGAAELRGGEEARGEAGGGMARWRGEVVTPQKNSVSGPVLLPAVQLAVSSSPVRAPGRPLPKRRGAEWSLRCEVAFSILRLKDVLQT
jgi:hypothetical protein